MEWSRLFFSSGHVLMLRGLSSESSYNEPVYVHPSVSALKRSQNFPHELSVRVRMLLKAQIEDVL